MVLNPASGSGRGAQLLPDVQRVFAAHDIRLTRTRGHEVELTRRALDEGFDTIVAVGGDGTWSGAARAIVDSGRDARLALVAAGTGNDFATALRLPAHDLDATLRLALGDDERRVDVGRIDGRVFLNVAGFGFDVAVLENMERPGRLRGIARYYASALSHLFRYPGLAIGIDGRDARSTLLLTVANGRRFGGAFEIAPGASVTDGVLDIVMIGNASPLARARLFAAATRGRHVSHAEVATMRASSFTLRFDAPPTFETDGELQRARSRTVAVECLPSALRIAAP